MVNKFYTVSIGTGVNLAINMAFDTNCGQCQ